MIESRNLVGKVDPGIVDQKSGLTDFKVANCSVGLREFLTMDVW